MTQDGPKMAPSWPQDDPGRAQDGPTWPQDGPGMATSLRVSQAVLENNTHETCGKIASLVFGCIAAQDGPRRSRDGSRRSLLGFPWPGIRPMAFDVARHGLGKGPRWLQDGPRKAQDGPQMAPRWPHDGPRRSQNH